MGRLLIASTRKVRLRGLIGRDLDDGMLLLLPCNDIHTFGMEYAIDVAFLDRRGRVVESRRDVLPKRRMHCRGAYATIERFSQPMGPWLQEGDYLHVFECEED